MAARAFRSKSVMAERSTIDTVRALLSLSSSKTSPEEISQLFGEDAYFEVPGPPELIPWAGGRHGREGVESFFRLHRELVEVIVFDADTLIVEGPRAVITGRLQSRVRATGRPIESAFAAEIKVDGGMIQTYRLYEDTYAVASAVLHNPSSQLPRISNPTELYDPSRHGYSQLAVTSPRTKAVTVAGQFGIDRSGAPISEDFHLQAERALENVETALRSEGLSLAHIVKLTVLIVSLDDSRLAMFEAAVKKRFSKGPPTTLIPVSRLAAAGMLIEIDAVASS